MITECGRKLFKFSDAVIIFFVLFSVFLFYFFSNTKSSEKNTAVVTVNGENIKTIDLSSAENEIFTLKTEPTVTLEINNGKIRFTNSKCPDGTCEKCGWLSKPGDTAACLPAKTVVSINGVDDKGVDAVVG